MPPTDSLSELDWFEVARSMTLLNLHLVGLLFILICGAAATLFFLVWCLMLSIVMAVSYPVLLIAEAVYHGIQYFVQRWRGVEAVREFDRALALEDFQDDLAEGRAKLERLRQAQNELDEKSWELLSAQTVGSISVEEGEKNGSGIGAEVEEAKMNWSTGSGCWRRCGFDWLGQVELCS